MSVISLFNRRHTKQNRARARAGFADYRFLYDWCEREILDRLSIIRRDFPQTSILNDLSSENFRLSLLDDKRIGNLTIVEEHPSSLPVEMEALNLDPASQDLVISILDLHSVNDLPGTLVQIRQALKPDGLFIGCMFGGETLHELRQSLMQAELEISGGASPRVFPFADKQQMGGLLQRAGFALPVVDSDILKVSYRDILHLMQDLKGMGETNSIADRRKTLTPRSLFAMAQAAYDQNFKDPDGKITASFEIISLIGWAPHQSQQKPLRPGSATARLAAVLETEEYKAE